MSYKFKDERFVYAAYQKARYYLYQSKVNTENDRHPVFEIVK